MLVCNGKCSSFMEQGLKSRKDALKAALEGKGELVICGYQYEHTAWFYLWVTHVHMLRERERAR